MSDKPHKIQDREEVPSNPLPITEGDNGKAGLQRQYSASSTRSRFAKVLRFGRRARKRQNGTPVGKSDSQDQKLPRRLLLTSVCRPIGPRHGDGTSVGYELLHGQVTRAQGFFSPRSHQIQFSLEYIANNLQIPTVVLHYPSERELIRELKKGYQYIGMSFVLSLFHRMRRVVELIRRYSPQSKIILGGYGTVLSDEELKPYADYICREEGAGFVRRLLGEDANAPYEHPVVINDIKVFSLSQGDNGMIFGGLGCPNGCDFCCTSHFFKRRHIRLLPTGKDIFGVVTKYRGIKPQIKFTVLDEDFLLNRKRGLDLLAHARNSGQDLSMFVFGSVRALSQYSMEELLEMGISGVWIGYEGRRSNFEKQQGRPVDDVIRGLQAHGIVVLASMIIGFEYQTPEIIQEELDQLMEDRPTFAQFLIYGPLPGTPFYERVTRERKLRNKFVENRDAFYRRCTGFYNTVAHPTMSTPQIEEIQRDCFRQDFNRLGPSIIRSIATWMAGYQRLKATTNPRLRLCVERYRTDILNAIPAIPTAMWLGPSAEARKRARELYRSVTQEFGRPNLIGYIKSVGSIGVALWTAMTLRFDRFQQPKLIRNEYRVDKLRKSVVA